MKPKQRFVEMFFNNWSSKMAYILGYFAADGSMYKNPRGGCYIASTSCDLELIQKVKKILRVSNCIEIYQSKHLNWKLRYTIQIGSKIVFNKFLELGLTPAKSLSLVFPTVPNNFVNHFIRGYFDGDGNAYFKLSKRGNRNGYAKHLHFCIRCGSKRFLETMRTTIENLYQIGPGSLSYYSNAFSLAYSGKNVIKLYRFLYPNKSILHLTRKRLKLEEGIRCLGS
ncbi:hypothetical protein HYW43_03605 [Candidatus Daviesbacteria bacterium]|nr:hypothetical protein [Candidatus Daviesbacteria bacterium]